MTPYILVVAKHASLGASRSARVTVLGGLAAFFTRSLSDTFLASTGWPSERSAFVMWTLLAMAAATLRLPHDGSAS